jgi:broad specificity phosphatase PhoE
MTTPDSDITHLYLVRHGATEANERRPYVLQGRGVDLGLSPAGRRQAEAVGRFLAGFPLRHVYSSQLLRAVETARAIAAHHNVEVSPLVELSECHVGQWEGMDWDAIMRDHPDAWKAFMENPAECPYLGGESYGDVLRRVKPVIGELLDRHRGESFAIVAHNVVNRVYLAHLLGLDLRHAKGLHQSNGCVNLVRHREGETSLITLNASFHLS